MAGREVAESCRKFSVQVAGMCTFGSLAADSADSRESKNSAVPECSVRVIRENRCPVSDVATCRGGILWQRLAGKLDWGGIGVWSLVARQEPRP